MDVTPSPIVGSVLQSTPAQQQQSRTQDSEANRRATAARELALLEQQQADAIEDTDSESRVHADSGGQGSRGRAFEEHAPDRDSSLDQPDPDDPSGGTPRLDVTA